MLVSTVDFSNNFDRVNGGFIIDLIVLKDFARAMSLVSVVVKLQDEHDTLNHSVVKSWDVFAVFKVRVVVIVQHLRDLNEIISKTLKNSDISFIISLVFIFGNDYEQRYIWGRVFAGICTSFVTQGRDHELAFHVIVCRGTNYMATNFVITSDFFVGLFRRDKDFLTCLIVYFILSNVFSSTGGGNKVNYGNRTKGN